MEEFAQGYEMKGEKLVCCSMRSRMSDEFYGQWLFLHIPFRSTQEFENQKVRERVPQAMQNFGLAISCSNAKAQGFWRNEECMTEEMQQEI